MSFCAGSRCAKATPIGAEISVIAMVAAKAGRLIRPSEKGGLPSSAQPCSAKLTEDGSDSAQAELSGSDLDDEIDFDDMLNAPTIQDFWLLLPGHYPDCRRELDLMLDGYLQFRDFDFNSLKLIEPLRAMRIIYFLAWCGTQANDYDFSRHFPDWGTEQFWRREVTDLRKQLALLR